VKKTKRFLIGAAGFLVVALGVVLMPLPGPGVLVVLLGVLILATQFEWAERRVDQVKEAALRGAADSVSGGTTDMVGKVGSGLGSAATSLREHSPESGMLKTAAGKVADTLESSGRYLEQEGLSGMADDLTGMIKRNPIPSLLIALGVGFLLARATRS